MKSSAQPSPVKQVQHQPDIAPAPVKKTGTGDGSWEDF
jgi:hypothetical protein